MTCDCHHLELEPNPDIGGLGVLIGFLGTAWLSVLIVIVRYILALDPHVDPLYNPNSSQKSTWRPNPVDVRMTRIFEKLRARLGNHRRWEAPVVKMLLAMCDIQILTGLGVLLSGFIGLDCYVSAYHWQLIVYLAWFSNVTHAACLSSLRTYLYKNQTERNYRMGLMLLLLAGLIAALVPTAYFNWDLAGRQGSAAHPESNA